MARSRSRSYADPHSPTHIPHSTLRPPPDPPARARPPPRGRHLRTTSGRPSGAETPAARRRRTCLHRARRRRSRKGRRQGRPRFSGGVAARVQLLDTRGTTSPSSASKGPGHVKVLGARGALRHRLARKTRGPCFRGGDPPAPRTVRTWTTRPRAQPCSRPGRNNRRHGVPPEQFAPEAIFLQRP